MPELPEVETVVRFLDSHIKGERIQRIEVLREKNIVTGSESFVKDSVGVSFTHVNRKGKHLLFYRDDSKIMLVHLRMEGKFFYFEKGQLRRSKHDILLFEFESGNALVYNDVRKFGTIGLYDENSLIEDSPLAKLGPDPYEIEPQTLYNGICQSSLPIKSLLMDQAIISGIGNIYTDEICFATSIDPRTEGKRITPNQCESIIAEAKRIMDEAIDLGGSTVKSYHPALGMDGKMQNQLLAYHNTGDCPRCDLPMRRIFINGRSTHFCPNCQQQENRPLTIAVTGPIHTGKSSVVNYLKDRNYPVFDSDKTAKSLYFDQKCKTKIEKLIGKKIIKKGVLQTDALRKALLDKKVKKQVTDILYPALKEKAEQFIADHSSQRIVIMEIPLLKGSGLEDLIDYIIYVDAPIERRRERLLKEGKEADTMIALNKGYPEAATKKEASYIVVNDAGLEELYKQIEAIPILQ